MLVVLALACSKDSTSPGGPVVDDVGPFGGTVTTPNGRFSITVPAGALTEMVTLEIDSMFSASDTLALPRTTFRIDPPTLAFSKPATVTILYDAGVMSTSREKSVGMYTDSSTLWRVLPGSTADLSARSVSAPIMGAGRFALVALGPVAAVSVVPTSVMVVIGTTQPLTCTLQDSNGKSLDNRPVSWTSADTTVAQVTPLGLVLPIGLGITNVTAASTGASANSIITVSFTCKCPVLPTPGIMGTAAACAC